jgi:hypothetical protein
MPPPTNGNERSSDRSLRYLTIITETRPLTIWFCICNPPGSGEPITVPRPLTPIGAFLRIEVFDQDGQVVYHTDPPKMKLKLDPSKAQSYLTLEPGYTHGVMAEIADLRLPAGDYRLRLAYSNLMFTGTRERPLGELRHETSVGFRA